MDLQHAGRSITLVLVSCLSSFLRLHPRVTWCMLNCRYDNRNNIVCVWISNSFLTTCLIKFKYKMGSDFRRLRIIIDNLSISRKLGLYERVAKLGLDIEHELVDLYEAELENDDAHTSEGKIYLNSEWKLLEAILEKLCQQRYLAEIYDEVTKFVRLKVSCHWQT